MEIVSSLERLRLLEGVTAEGIAEVARHVEMCRFRHGSVILSHDQEPDSLYLILEGEVAVRLPGEGKGEVIARLGPGDHVGERALLTRDRRSSDVVALNDVTAARIGHREFEELLERIPRLSVNLCRDLAGRLGGWNVRHVKEESEHRRVVSGLSESLLFPDFDVYPGSSPFVVELNRRIGEIPPSRHVLIVGEAGTWKDLVARLIHEKGEKGRPVVFFDCGAPLHGMGEDEEDQDAARRRVLFGNGTEHGLVALAFGGDLILRNVERLDPALQESLAGSVGEGKIRLIATAGHPRMPVPGICPRLGTLFGGEVIEMIPLRERRQDIPAMVRELLPLLNRKHGKRVRRVSPEGMNRLLSHDWPLNGTELQQVLGRAVVMTEGDTIPPEAILLQGGPFVDGRLDLLSLEWFGRLAKNPHLSRRGRWVTVPLFSGILLMTLFGPLYLNPANVAVWTLWWPVLLLSTLVAARGWCSICPLESIGGFVGISTRVTRHPPEWLKRWGPPLSLAAILLILLTEQATSMFEYARSTGIFLLVLLVLTVISDLLLGRRGWCKYLCPLGRIVGLFSRLSVVTLRSTESVCGSRCRLDSCVRERGCPMGLHPSGLTPQDHCILCLDCFRGCPHRSIRVELGNPLSQPQAWSASWRDGVPLMILGGIVGVRIAPLLTDVGGEVWNPRQFLWGAAGAVTYLVLPLMASAPWRRGWVKRLAAVGASQLPLAFAALLSIYLRAIVEHGEDILPRLAGMTGLGMVLDPELFRPDLGSFSLLVVPLILVGLGLSLRGERKGGGSGVVSVAGGALLAGLFLVT